ncbi:MAG TPA: helix-hairpin-helix domain-containing protein [Chryseolinea sp.]|nr:helix-hairpin-helix domain-containing protein [Chryseolinea sp.]
MGRVRKWVRDFFSLSHSQANGFIVLIPLLAIIVMSEPVWHWYISRQPLDLSKDQAILDSIVAVWEAGESKITTPRAVLGQHSFRFDPNTATEQDFASLGFSKALASNIVRYRNRGGQFRTKTDLLKIYNMDTALYRRLRAFIELPVEVKAKEKKRFEGKSIGKLNKHAEIASFDINLADTAQLKLLRGIGEKLSLRIVKYRDALGGFVEMAQLREVYGLDSTVIETLSKFCFVKEGFTPHRINVNTATADELAAHPYLTGPEARSLVAYRFQHGKFEVLADLRKLQVIKEETIVKIMTYLMVANE